MANISSEADLRAHLRSELGLTNASRVRDEDIDAEIESAKRELSNAVARKLDSGETLAFYDSQAEVALENYVKVRFAPMQNRGAGRGKSSDRIPADHPRSVSKMRHTDFGNPEVNFWRDRMVRAFNRI